MTQVIQVNAEWDADAEVWVAASEDVPGLVTEADTMEALAEKLSQLIPELLDANGTVLSTDDGEVHFEVVRERQDRGGIGG